MINNILLITCSLAISLFGIVYIGIHRKNYGPLLYSIFFIICFTCMGIIYPTLIILVSEKIFNEETALLLWKYSIIVGVISLGILSLVYSFILEYEKINFISLFFIYFFGGIISYDIFNPNSVRIYSNSNYYYYEFSVPSLFFNLGFQFFLIIYLYHVLIKTRVNFKKKKFGRAFILLSIQFSLTILLHSIYIFLHEILFRNLFIISLIFGEILALYVFVKFPNLFILLTNKIGNIIVFHKSGILLYSLNFETMEEGDESLLKGSILIGINHILNNFIGKKDKLNLIKMKEYHVIFEIDATHGYAMIVTSNQMNKLIVKAVKSFMEKFTSLNKEDLMDINNPKKLIDISKFYNSRDLIVEAFNLFLL